MSIYRWAKLDDQSGPDRSIELRAIGTRISGHLRSAAPVCFRKLYLRRPWRRLGLESNRSVGAVRRTHLLVTRLAGQLSVKPTARPRGLPFVLVLLPWPAFHGRNPASSPDRLCLTQPSILRVARDSLKASNVEAKRLSAMHPAFSQSRLRSGRVVGAPYRGPARAVRWGILRIARETPRTVDGAWESSVNPWRQHVG